MAAYVYPFCCVSKYNYHFPPFATQRLNLAAPTGLLLYGPSGCGKTLCVNAFARSSGLNTIYVKA